MPLILSGNVASATASTGYDVDNSCRFNRASSESLERTPGSAGNRRTFTFSCWFKLGNLASSQSDYYQIFGGFDGSGNDGLWISDSDKLYIYLDSGERRITNQVIRDPSAWYNAVLAIDTTQGTAANRIKLYLNGSEITSFSTNSDPTLNYDSGVNDTSLQNIGERVNDDYFDGYIAEAVLIDGLQLTPTSFGEFDEDSPTIWKPIDVSGLTFGTNGFYLDFEDSSALGNDVSGNDNDFTVNNLDATDQATDTPTNNFATFNPLTRTRHTLSEGNCQTSPPDNGYKMYGYTTIAAESGKWYCEMEHSTNDNKTNYGIANVADAEEISRANDTSIGGTGKGVGYYSSSGVIYENGSTTAHGSALSDNDIIGIAMDLDNNKVYFSINGTWQNSADPSAGTNAFVYSSTYTTGQIVFCCGDNRDVGGYDFVEANFGGCSAFTVSSANQDGNGYGNFEYTVPTGFYALCTKNLAEFG